MSFFIKKVHSRWGVYEAMDDIAKPIRLYSKYSHAARGLVEAKRYGLFYYGTCGIEYWLHKKKNGRFKPKNSFLCFIKQSDSPVIALSFIGITMGIAAVCGSNNSPTSTVMFSTFSFVAFFAIFFLWLKWKARL